MRNPGLRFVGITSGPVGVGVFGNRAEEELRLWLESRLDALGIDPVAYTRCVLSLLRRPDSALSPGPDLPGTKSRTQGKNNKQQQRTKTKLSQQSEREHKRAVVQCLTNASDQTCYGVESLVDELCAKLRDLEGSNNNNNNNNTDDNQIDCQSIEKKNKTDTSNNIETLTSRDKVLRYYAAFPALQPSTPKKVTQKKTNNNNNKIINNNNNNISNLKKYRNIGINGKNNNKNSNDKHNNSNNNNNNNININNNNNNNNNNHKGRQAKKTKMSIQVIDTRKIEEKETFGFAKSLEREREKELDDLRLAQLQAKFDESLEALWDSGPGNSSDKSSIWAAPSLSIPSGPHWPINTDELPLILPTKTPYNDYIIDDPQIIPWNIDLIGIGKNDKKLNYNFNWSNNIDNDAPWSLKDIGNNLINMEKGLKTTGCFIPIPPNNKSLVDKKKLIVNEDKCKVNDKINDYHDNDSDEDLLTSNKTHFRPIKDDGNWADGTTFPVNNHFERVAYRRSNSKNLLYLPGGESPYMEYKDNTTTTSTSSSSSSSSNGNNFTLKFRVRQCDKSIQTDPIRSPVKRRIINEKNNFYYPSINDILNNDMDDDDVDEHDEDDKDASFTIGPLGWIKPSVGLISDRKRRHSSSFKCRPLAALRPLTL